MNADLCMQGLLLDKGMSSEQLARHLQVANAARATLGMFRQHFSRVILTFSIRLCRN